jgi:hypothetical protein
MREGVAGLPRDETRKPGLPPLLPPTLVDRVVALPRSPARGSVARFQRARPGELLQVDTKSSAGSTASAIASPGVDRVRSASATREFVIPAKAGIQGMRFVACPGPPPSRG